MSFKFGFIFFFFDWRDKLFYRCEAATAKSVLYIYLNLRQADWPAGRGLNISVADFSLKN